jgi:hypothetical protein
MGINSASSLLDQTGDIILLLAVILPVIWKFISDKFNLGKSDKERGADTAKEYLNRQAKDKEDVENYKKNVEAKEKYMGSRRDVIPMGGGMHADPMMYLRESEKARGELPEIEKFKKSEKYKSLPTTVKPATEPTTVRNSAYKANIDDIINEKQTQNRDITPIIQQQDNSPAPVPASSNIVIGCQNWMDDEQCRIARTGGRSH